MRMTPGERAESRAADDLEEAAQSLKTVALTYCLQYSERDYMALLDVVDDMRQRARELRARGDLVTVDDD